MNTVGRPTEYNEDIISKSMEYIESCVDEIDEFHKTRGEKSDSYDRLVEVKLPTIEGLAVYLKVARSTVYKWAEEKPEFSDILEQLQSIQAERLINNGLNGNYNPIIAKLILMKHGYKEKIDTDITSGGKSIGGFNFIRNDGDNNTDNKTN